MGCFKIKFASQIVCSDLRAMFSLAAIEIRAAVAFVAFS